MLYPISTQCATSARGHIRYAFDPRDKELTDSSVTEHFSHTRHLVGTDHTKMNNTYIDTALMKLIDLKLHFDIWQN